MNSREISPATITMANGFWVSDPIPVDRAALSRDQPSASMTEKAQKLGRLIER